MTPSQQAKALGCESLAQVARVSGVNPRTLLNYHKHKPWLFEAVCEKVARYESKLNREYGGGA